MANTVRAENGMEIYETKIHEYADEYINTLDDPESINNNPSLFTGMIRSEEHTSELQSRI